MSSFPLPALHVNPPTDPTEGFQRLLAMRGLMQQQAGQQQEQQMRALEIQKAQRDAAQTQAINSAYHDALTTDANGQVSIDQGKLTDALSRSNHGSAIPSILKNINDYQKSQADLTETQGKNLQAARDSIGFLGAAIQKSNYDPNLADLLIEQRLRQPGVPPAEAQQLQQLRGQIQQNPQTLKTITDNLVAQSKQARETAASETTANARMLQATTAQSKLAPLAPMQIQQLNRQLQARFQVLNPGGQLPAEFTLPPNAKRQDYEDVDKALEQVEKAKGVKAQQDTANAIREQSAQNTLEKTDRKAVVGTNPQTGEQVLVPAGDAKAMGLTGVMDADADMVNKATAARHWLQLATKQAPADAAPQDMGIMQLIDKMDKSGKLGPLAGRWNDFLTGKWGAGDADYSALRNKMGLSTTKLMQAHVGSRGGAAIMEHFEDLASAKKMDANTLRTSMASEVNYMKDVAMLPPEKQAAPPAKSAPAAKPQAKTLSMSQIQQAAKDHGVSVDEAKRQAQAAGYQITQ